MKPILREVAIVTSLLSLVLCAGCQGQKANADELPSVSNPAPVALEAPGAPKSAQLTPPTPPAPAQVTVIPPGSIIITNANPKPAALADGSVSAPIAQIDTNVHEAVVPPAELNLSPALSEVVKLVQAGVGEGVLAAYVTNSTDVFNIGASEILYLHDLGMPESLITVLIQQDSTPQALAAKKAALAVKPLPPGMAATTPAPAVYPPTTAQAAAPATDATNLPPSTPGAQTPAVVYTVPAVEQPVTVNQFYTELSPYGSWIEVPGYGRCWRPTVAVWNSSWRPYADGGRWLWTDSGWYWYSDYSWGWAPFHYGRWTTHVGIGWVWAPDTHWGPAWVSWRRSSSHCGWAPLPPSAHWVAGRGFYHNTLSVGVSFEFGLSDHHYVYLPYNRFCDRRPSHYYLPAHQARSIHRETTVVNNYVSVNNNRVVNHGVGFDRVAALNKGNIRQVSLRPTSDVPRGTLRREILDNDGKTLTVARPVSTASSAGITPPARPVSSLSNLRPQTGRASSPATANISAPSNSRDITTVQSGSPKPDSARGPKPIVVRGGVRPNADSQTATTTPAPATGVTVPQSGGGRTVPAPQTTRSVETPGGGRPAVTPGSETGSRSAVVMRPASGPTTVARVPAPVARQEAPRVSGGPAQPSRAPVFNNDSPAAAQRSAPSAPSYNSGPRPSATPSAPTYNSSPRAAVTPSPAPRAESSRAPSPPPSVQRSVPTPSPSPSRSSGDTSSRSSRSSGDDNSRKNSR